MKVAAVDDEGGEPEALLERGERGGPELLVVGVAADAVALEADGLLLELVQNTERGERAAEVGRNLDPATRARGDVGAESEASQRRARDGRASGRAGERRRTGDRAARDEKGERSQAYPAPTSAICLAAS